MIEKEKIIQEFLDARPEKFANQVELLALWFDGIGDWEKSHEQVDQLPGKNAARIHAYLHRKEGDQWNADYWYRRAGEERPNLTLEQEWEELVRRFLKFT